MRNLVPASETELLSLDFERTHDMGLAREILTHPKIWPWITDDFSPRPEDFEPMDSESAWYVTVTHGSTRLGLFLFTPQNAICWEVHTCLLPEAWGFAASRAAKQAQSWIWRETRCRRIVTSVPIYNRLALRFALAAGMVQYGRNPASIERGGKLWDQILLGVSKPESKVIEFRCPPSQPSSPEAPRSGAPS